MYRPITCGAQAFVAQKRELFREALAGLKGMTKPARSGIGFMPWRSDEKGMPEAR
jgi:hypothetical protein